MNRFIHQIAAVLLMLGSSLAGAAEISAEDVLRAMTLADTHPWSEVSQRRRSESTLGVQTITVESAEQKNRNQTKLVLVYQFDHSSQLARRLDIDLAENQIKKDSIVNSVHLPLNQNEIDHAIALLNVSTLRDKFPPLDQLNVKAVVFEPNDPVHICAVERCALLSLFDETRTVFATEPVVHFASGEVREIGRW